MKKNKSESFDITAFFKDEILLTRINVDRIRKDSLSNKMSYSSLSATKKNSDKKLKENKDIKRLH